MNMRACRWGLCLLLSLVLVSAVLETATGEDVKEVKRWTKSRVAGLSHKSFPQAIKDVEHERKAIVAGLMAVARSTKRADTDRRAAILSLGRLREPRGLAFCLENINLVIPAEDDEVDPTRNYPCMEALRNAGWCTIPAILTFAVHPSRKKQELISLATVLGRVCEPTVAAAIIHAHSERIAWKQRPNLEFVARLLEKK